MGKRLFDQYTYLHFCTGAIMYFWGFSLTSWFVIHTIFEVVENTKMGIDFINKFSFWPGGKPEADSLTNSIGDTIGGMLGWVSSYAICKIGTKKGWYDFSSY